MFGAIVAPLVGIGDIMHSTAIVFSVMALLVFASAYLTHRLAPDPDMVSDTESSAKDKQ